MGTFTAYILVGNNDRFHGGIIPSNAVYLSEGSRPTWILDTIDLFGDETIKKNIRWISTLENILRRCNAINCYSSD